MSGPRPSYDIAQLSDLAGITPRTVRYYIAQGLIPAPAARGAGSHYSADHLERLRVIRSLQREHLPLAEIRRRMERLADEEIRAIADAEGRRAPPTSALEYVRETMAAIREPRAEEAQMFAAMLASPSAIARDASPAVTRPPSTVQRSQWDRIELAQDVELHIRRPLTRDQNKRVEQLLDVARTLFEEDMP